MKIKVSNVNTPNWKEVTVKSRIPEELEKLSEIARNIWWAWNFEATELFRDLDPELWKECGQNPVLLLERMSYEKLEALVEEMSNTKSATLIGALNNYPVISVSAHVRPFHIYWLNLVAGVIFPIGLFFYFRIWAFRVRLAKDMERIIKNNEQIQFIIQKINK